MSPPAQRWNPDHRLCVGPTYAIDMRAGHRVIYDYVRCTHNNDTKTQRQRVQHSHNCTSDTDARYECHTCVVVGLAISGSDILTIAPVGLSTAWTQTLTDFREGFAYRTCTVGLQSDDNSRASSALPCNVTGPLISCGLLSRVFNTPPTPVTCPGWLAITGPVGRPNRIRLTRERHSLTNECYNCRHTILPLHESTQFESHVLLRGARVGQLWRMVSSSQSP